MTNEAIQKQGEEVNPTTDELFIEPLKEAKPMEAVKTDRRAEKRGGYYWIDGEPYPSVTQVLGVVDKPALRYWFGREVYRAMVGNPSLGEKEALAVPYKIGEDSKSRGSTVHSIVEAYKHTKEHIEGIPEQFRGYAQAFYQWVEDYHITIVEHERTVVSMKHKFAGTLDMLVKLNGGEQLVVIDCKTGKDIYPESFLQLSAYSQALKEEGTEVGGRGVVLLQEDGSYKYQFTMNDYFRPFFACKVLWEWINAEEIQKVRQYAKGGVR